MSSNEELNEYIMIYTYNGISYRHIKKRKKRKTKMRQIDNYKKVLHLGGGTRSLGNLFFTLFFSVSNV